MNALDDRVESPSRNDLHLRPAGLDMPALALDAEQVAAPGPGTQQISVRRPHPDHPAAPLAKTSDCGQPLGGEPSVKEEHGAVALGKMVQARPVAQGLATHAATGAGTRTLQAFRQDFGGVIRRLVPRAGDQAHAECVFLDPARAPAGKFAVGLQVDRNEGDADRLVSRMDYEMTPTRVKHESTIARSLDAACRVNALTQESRQAASERNRLSSIDRRVSIMGRAVPGFPAVKTLKHGRL